MRNLFARAFAFPIAVLACSAALSQDYPNKPVRLVNIASPGALQDIVARVVAQGMTKSLGQNVIVENKPAAGGIIGYEYVARQMPADGYNIVLSGASLATFHIFNKDLRFDPLADLPPFSVMVETPTVLASPLAAPWNGFNEMIAFAKANPGKLNWGLQGLQGQPRLVAEVVRHKHGINIVMVPYSQGGSSAVRQALLTNDVQLAWMALVDEKKWKPLGIGASKRLAAFANVPTFTELGHPEFTGNWLSLNARAGTPRPILERLHTAAQFGVQQPEMGGLVEKNYLVTVAQGPEAAVKRFNEEAQFFTRIARQVGLKPE